jgi:hypothetical protein
MRWIRQFAALLLVPVVAGLAFAVAIGWDGESQVIDSVGSWLGLGLVSLGMLAVSRAASHIGWRRRMVAVFVLATIFYAVRWANRPADYVSFDESPEVVAWAVTLGVFMPLVVIAAMIEDTWRKRNDDRFNELLAASRAN